MPLLLDGAQRTEEWFLARKGRITASVVAACLGLDRHKSARKAWKEIVCAEYTKPNQRMLWGGANEGNARNAYEEESGNLVFETGFWVHPLYPWLGCSPDGLIGSDGLLECKCPYEITGRIPLTVRFQVLTQLLVTGREWCDIFYWTPLVTFCERMHRAGDGSALIAKLEEFYLTYVVTKVCPPRKKRKPKCVPPTPPSPALPSSAAQATKP